VKRLTRFILWLLLLELIAAFAVATAIRIKLEKPVRYIGSALPALPHHVDDAGTPILDAGQHEQQIAQAIQVSH